MNLRQATWHDIGRKALRSYCRETGKKIIRYRDIRKIINSFYGMEPASKGCGNLLEQLLQSKTLKKTKEKGVYEINWFSKKGD